MRIIITGSSGYIGKALIENLEERHHQVISINRELLYGSTDNLQDVIRNFNTIICLSGSSILKRWTKTNKKVIYDSRVITTRNLVKAINGLPIEEQPQKYISASAVGIYKSGQYHDEHSTDFDNGFLGEVVKDWEDASADLPEKVNHVVFRIGLIIGKEAKPIKNLLLPIKLGLGAMVGNGRQPFPFIHVSDVLKAFIQATESDNYSGIYNLVAPQIVTNGEFTKILGKCLNRTIYFRIPGFIVKLFLGKASSLLTFSPEVAPTRLLHSGFKFSYPTIKEALNEIVLGESMKTV